MARASARIDLTGRWLLLAGPEGRGWPEAAKGVAQGLSDLPLDAWRVGGELTDTAGVFSASVGISPAGAILVRPDGFVAWRSEGSAAQPATALRAALSSALAW